jgi:hypothetical protein
VGFHTDTLSGLSPLAGFTTGIGLHWRGQEFSYAWAPMGDLGNSQYFSILCRFGEATQEKRNLIDYKANSAHPQRKTPATEAPLEYEQLYQLLNAGKE